jgi:hypothetical protein
MPIRFTAIATIEAGQVRIRAHAGHMDTEGIAAYMEGLGPGSYRVEFTHMELWSDIGDPVGAPIVRQRR